MWDLSLFFWKHWENLMGIKRIESYEQNTRILSTVIRGWDPFCGICENALWASGVSHAIAWFKNTIVSLLIVDKSSSPFLSWHGRIHWWSPQPPTTCTFLYSYRCVHWSVLFQPLLPCVLSHHSDWFSHHRNTSSHFPFNYLEPRIHPQSGVWWRMGHLSILWDAVWARGPIAASTREMRWPDSPLWFACAVLRENAVSY